MDTNKNSKKERNTIQAIDPKARTVSLNGRSFRIGMQVAADDFKVGDSVNVAYDEKGDDRTITSIEKV